MDHSTSTPRAHPTTDHPTTVRYTLTAWYGRDLRVTLQLDARARVADVRRAVEDALDDEWPILDGMDAEARCDRGPTSATLTRDDDGATSPVTIDWLPWVKPCVSAWIERWPL